ncbi:regulatory protein RecX [Thalassotalea sediminis]|uniref:regulatory protein RecX n=1 Tax=Thalassotalea sediminis TaxID=1759089 RepID=UPI0025728EB3|nr:regulatory protein RecX [Thalassotalea sediminis]
MNKDILHTGIDLLSRREHSVKELKQKFLQRGYASEDFSDVIEFLVANQYLSEQRFTESVFRNRINKGYGAKYIEQELMQKGIDSTMINNVAEEMSVDWQEVATRVYDKKFGTTPITDDKNKAKRIRFLQYRGFASQEIFSLINES